MDQHHHRESHFEKQVQGLMAEHLHGRKAAETFMGNLRVAAIETHVADARTCCLHPASATHRQMNDEELRAAGIAPELVRYSCGIENAQDRKVLVSYTTYGG